MTPSLRKELWRTPDLLGFAAHWTWIWCVFWSSLFYGEGTLLGSSVGAGAATGLAGIALEPLWVTSLLANVVTIAFLLPLSYLRNPLSDVKGLPPLAAVLTALGTVAISHPALAGTGDGASTLYLAGSLLTGVGSGIVVVLWAELLASLGSQRTVNYSVVSLLIAAVAYLLVRLLPIDVAQLVVALLPLVSMGCFVHFKRSVPRPPRAMRNVRVREKPPVRMMVIAVFFGVSFGAMKGLIAPVGDDWIGVRDQLNIIAIAGGALAVFVTMSVYKMDFDHLTYQIALPLMAAGFLFLPLHEPWNVIGTAVHQFGYQYFYIVLWALWPVLASRGGVPTGWVVGWGLLCIQLGQFVGSVAAALALTVVHGDLGLAMLSAGIVFVILIIALFAMGSGSANTGWGVRETDGGGRRHVRPREGGHAPGAQLPLVAARDRGVLPAGEGAQPRLHPRGAGHRRRDGEEPREEHLPQNRRPLPTRADRPARARKRRGGIGSAGIEACRS